MTVIKPGSTRSVANTETITKFSDYNDVFYIGIGLCLAVGIGFLTGYLVGRFSHNSSVKEGNK